MHSAYRTGSAWRFGMPVSRLARFRGRSAAIAAAAALCTFSKRAPPVIKVAKTKTAIGTNLNLATLGSTRLGLRLGNLARTLNHHYQL